MSIFDFLKKSKKGHGLSYTEFEKWLDKSMCFNIPKDVVAFCFNIYDDGNSRWSIELVGASSFDAENSDWPCDEVFTTRDNPFIWHEDVEWAQILNEVQVIVKKYLEIGRYGKTMRQYKGIGLGFVEGDLIIM